MAGYSEEEMAAIRLIKEAIAYDQKADWKTAIKTYKKSVELMRELLRTYPPHSESQQRVQELHDTCFKRGEELYYKVIRRQAPPTM